VDVTLILESVTPEMLQSGTWLNIVGYVNGSLLRKGRALGSESTWVKAEGGSVQALLVWSAGALRIGDYERILMRQHEAAKQLQRTV
jgi:Telomere capping, CST complex subunit